MTKVFELGFSNGGAVLGGDETLPVAWSIFSSISSPMSVWPASISMGRRARVFHGVEDRSNLEPRHTPPEALVRDEGMSSPVNRGAEWRRTCGGASADHITDVGDQVALGGRHLELLLIGPRGAGWSASMPGAQSSGRRPARAAGCRGGARRPGAGDRSSCWFRG